MEHAGKRPRVAPSAYVAPTAMICGDVTIGEGVRVLFGAVVVAEGGRVDIGAECIIMEHAVIRGVARYPTHLAVCRRERRDGLRDGVPQSGKAHDPGPRVLDAWPQAPHGDGYPPRGVDTGHRSSLQPIQKVFVMVK